MPDPAMGQALFFKNKKENEMKKIIKIIFVSAAILGGIWMLGIPARQNEKVVFSLLEKDWLNNDEKAIIQQLMNPDIEKDGFVLLDEKHKKLFVEHFGHEPR